MTDFNDDHLREIKVESEAVYKGGFFEVFRDTVRMPSGNISQREYIRHPGAVAAIPLLDDGNVLLERQFRYPVDKVFIEFPAGKIDANEDPLVCAQRELHEETGYTATDWQFLCTIHNAIGYSSERLYLYLARGLQAGERHPDEDELVETFSASIPQLLEWVREGRITDVKTVIGIFWLDKLTSEKWKI